MPILIVGVDHELQAPGVRGMSSDEMPRIEEQDKTRFRQLLTELIRDRGITFIGEEEHPTRRTIAQEVTQQLGVRHEFIDMPVEERNRRGIPPGYSRNLALSNQQRESYHSQREHYMACRTEELGARSEHCMVICGLDHMQGLSELFESCGHPVERINVEEQSGFDLRWLHRHLFADGR